MATNADDLIDRRRLRRKLTFWRVAALFVAALAIFAGTMWLGGDEFAGTATDHIAKIRVEGTITEDEELLEELEAVRKADTVKGVILSVDSPGGTTAGGEAIFEAVRQLAAAKPVVAQVGTLAASAGYMIASASDHIVARKSSIVGSIGVLDAVPQLHRRHGEARHPTRRGEVVAAEGRAVALQSDDGGGEGDAALDDHGQLRLVRRAGRRPPSAQPGRGPGAGRRFSVHRPPGADQQARRRARRRTGVDWLGTKGVDKALKVVEWKPKASNASLLFSEATLRQFARMLGLPEQGADVLREIVGDRIFLDGLLSVWHGERAVTGG